MHAIINDTDNLMEKISDDTCLDDMLCFIIIIEPQLSFTQPEYFVSEEDGQVMVCVDITSLNCTEVDIVSTIETADGNATSKHSTDPIASMGGKYAGQA